MPTKLQQFFDWLVREGRTDRPISELMDLYREFTTPVDNMPQYHKPKFKETPAKADK
jgi:hypothetical protein